MKRLLISIIFTLLISELYAQIPEQYLGLSPDIEFFAVRSEEWEEERLYYYYILEKVESSEANLAVIKGIPEGFSMLKDGRGPSILAVTLEEYWGYNEGKVFIILYHTIEKETTFYVFDYDNGPMYQYTED